jgi:hypothetical protein
MSLVVAVHKHVATARPKAWGNVQLERLGLADAWETAWAGAAGSGRR